jgi:hypothetical protein
MKTYNILIFMLIVLMLLGTISFLFPKEGVDIKIRNLYFPDFEIVIYGDNSRSMLALEHFMMLEEELRLQRLKLLQDSIYNHSLSLYVDFIENNESRFDFPDNDINFFNDFFATLDSLQARGETARILHYGDSQIESDRITGYIRQWFQEKFGGSGPGLLPAVQPIPAFSVGQIATENIARYTIGGSHVNRAGHRRYGVLGQVGQIWGDGSIQIITRAAGAYSYGKVREIQNIRLFVGQDSSFTARVPYGGQAQQAEISKTSPIKVYTWNLPEPVSRFSIQMSGRAEIYGIAADGINGGVSMDNIPFRGGSGTFFTSIEKTVTQAMFDNLNVQLIILQFGGNLIPYLSNQSGITRYCDQLAEQIAYFKELSPQSKILLISPSDKSTRVSGQMATYPLLEPLIEKMKETAIQNGAAFWNLYKVMGGKNSMIEWVNHSPPLASPDHSHFTAAGVTRVASLFCEMLSVYYDYYSFIASKSEVLEDNIYYSEKQ